MAERKYERSREDWQAIAIDEAQTEIKETILRGVVNKWTYRHLQKQVTGIIKQLVDELESEELKAQCKTVLPRFASEVYNKTYNAFAPFPKHILTMVLTPPAEWTPEQRDRIHVHVMNLAPPDPSVYNQGYAAAMGDERYHSALKRALSEIVAMNPKANYVTPVNLRNIAEMDVRFQRHLDELGGMRERGVKLIMVPSHANCSERCEPYQGKIYSLDGSTGTTSDGKPYRPLETATKNPSDYYISQASGRAYYNGLFGFNCRHKMVEYKPGMRDIPIPRSVIDRRRKLEEGQRKMERQYRSLREKHALQKIAGDPTSPSTYHKAVELRKKYNAYCAQHGLVREDDRMKILPGENIYKPKATSKSKP